MPFPACVSGGCITGLRELAATSPMSALQKRVDEGNPDPPPDRSAWVLGEDPGWAWVHSIEQPYASANPRIPGASQPDRTEFAAGK